jgi:hypothetical protein
MTLDAGKVLKHSVLCPRCEQDYLFTLRAIAVPAAAPALALANRSMNH